MLFGVSFDDRDFFVGTTSTLHVIKRIAIDWEKAHRRAVFRGHVRNRRAICQRHLRNAFTEELNELANHTSGTQLLGHGQNQVSRSRTGSKFSFELKANDFWQQHVDRLAKHRCFGFDTTNTPAKHAQAIDHGRMTIGTDQSIWNGDRTGFIFADKNAFSQKLQVNLVDDTNIWRDNAEVIKRFLAPTQEFVSLAVTLEFEFDVQTKSSRAAKLVDLNTMVDYQVDGNQWVNLFWITTQAAHR